MTRGFSILEMVVVLAILGVLATVSLPAYLSFRTYAHVSSTSDDIYTALRSAQRRAQGMQADSSWGIHIASTQMTLFQGVDYASRTTASDEYIRIPTQITITGDTEITFDAFTGYPNQTSTLIVSENDVTRQITINEKGRITN